MQLLLVIIAVLSLVGEAYGFTTLGGSGGVRQFASLTKQSRAPAPRDSRLLAASDDKQAEIAELEAKLRQLKESPAVVEAEDESSAAPVEMPVDGEDEDDGMFLSEQWKVDDPEQAGEDGGLVGNIAKLAAVLGFVVFLGFFAQVPIGEEGLSKYQAVKNNVSRIDLGDLNPDKPQE